MSATLQDWKDAPGPAELALNGHQDDVEMESTQTSDTGDPRWNYIRDQARDWQINNGLLLTSQRFEIPRPYSIGVSLQPTPFLKVLFEEAIGRQDSFNRLYARVASDPEFLYDVLKDGFDTDPFVSMLWNIHERVQRNDRYVQPLNLAIFRSDYMMVQTKLEYLEEPFERPELKQVEFNTFSVAGTCHSARMPAMHQYIGNTGAYSATSTLTHSQLTEGHIQPNDTVDAIASSLANAHRAYGSPRNGRDLKLAILFVVQPNNLNICDERPIEYKLSPIPVHRVEFGALSDCISLGDQGELLYSHPTLPKITHEISVTYYRAGYDWEEYRGGYQSPGAKARYEIERSLSIKCPSILTQLAGTKKVQQVLDYHKMWRFFDDVVEALQLATSFMKMYNMKDPKAQSLALSNPEDYVLKPSSKEGGGHNYFSSAIPDQLSTIPPNELNNWVLMRKIKSPPTPNGVLASSDGEIYFGDTVSELGVFGSVLFRRGEKDELAEKRTEMSRYGVEIVENWGALGYSFKTKPVDEDEMSVVKGYGFFDSPLLI